MLFAFVKIILTEYLICLEQFREDETDYVKYHESFFNIVEFQRDPELEKIAKTLQNKKIPVTKYPGYLEPCDEYKTSYLDCMCFPHLFPTHKGSMFNKDRPIRIKLKKFIEHYTRYVDKYDDGMFFEKKVKMF